MLKTKKQREDLVFYTLFWLFIAFVIASAITLLGIFGFLLAIAGVFILGVIYVLGAMGFMAVDRWIEGGEK